MLSQLLVCCLLLVLYGSYVYSSPSCELRLSVSSSSVSDNTNTTVLCDTTCKLSSNHTGLLWYDNEFDQIPRFGRKFSINYGRGRYSRLVILQSRYSDAGDYVCTLEHNGHLFQKSFTLIYNGERPVDTVISRDNGPRRGDVYEHIIPRRRPKRGAYVTTQDPETTADMEDSGDDMTSSPEMDNAESSFSTNNLMTTTFPEMETIKVTPHKSESSMKVSPTPLPKTTTTRKPRPEPEPTYPEPKPEYTTVRSTRPKPEPPTKISTERSESGQNTGPNTEFGRIGLVAFVLSLSIALLLLYALLLIILIPICLKKRNSRQISKKKQPSKRDPQMTLSQLKNDQDNNGDLPSPGPSDAGFTTIDLDEPIAQQTQDKNQQENDKKESEEEKAMADESASKVEPQGGMMTSVMSAGEESKPGTSNDDLKFIDETSQEPKSDQLDDSSVFDNTTPEVIDEPPRPSTETTEVKLDITEKEDGQKRITLSTSSHPSLNDSSQDI